MAIKFALDEIGVHLGRRGVHMDPTVRGIANLGSPLGSIRNPDSLIVAFIFQKCYSVICVSDYYNFYILSMLSGCICSTSCVLEPYFI